MSLLSTIKQNRTLITRTLILQTRLQQTSARPKPKPTVLEVIPVFRKASLFVEKIALRDPLGAYSYGNVFMEAKELSETITQKIQGRTGERVMFLCPNDASYVITQWAIWMSGQIGIPLSSLHPKSLLLYFANDSNAKLIVTVPEYAELMQQVVKNTGTTLLVLDDKLRQNAMEKTPKKLSDMEAGLSGNFYSKENATILYTSGTTGNPKGVVLTHKNLVSQVNSLIDPWKWTPMDVILHTLPLHHVHGIVNALMCPLYIGAKCVMLPKFNANTVWSYLLGVNTGKTQDDRKISVYMAVPTVYAKLLQEYDRVFSSDLKMCEHIKNTLKSKFRLFVSGSAPLPVTVYERWLEVSGHRLLERYGMTEIGMCLSQVYDSDRKPGYVGIPLPGVSVRIGTKQEIDEGDYATLIECTNQDGQVKLSKDEMACDEAPVGELLVKGDNVFKEYYNRPETTQREFTIDGWFKTGDICQYSFDEKLFKMLGRKNVDIIKSGGFKVSALEVETHLLSHPDISDCAVIGVKDDVWGEKVVAVVTLKPDKVLSLDNLREWGKSKMAEYAVPKELKVVTELPKNAMGKVNKKDLAKIVLDGK